MTEAGSVILPLEARPIKNTICLFDVDGTLTPARRVSLFYIQFHVTQPLNYNLHFQL